MQVEVSGHQFVFPPHCVCCGRNPDSSYTLAATRYTGTRVVRSSTNTWAVPYCSQCLAHVNLAQASQAKMASAQSARTGFIAAGAVVFVVVGCALSFVASTIFGILVAILGQAAFIKLSGEARTLGEKARATCAPSCCSVGEAAAFLGWHGTVNAFDFASSQYAAAFMVSNMKKLVNLSPEATALLNSLGHGQPHGAPQRAQRYRS